MGTKRTQNIFITNENNYTLTGHKEDTKNIVRTQCEHRYTGHKKGTRILLEHNVNTATLDTTKAKNIVRTQYEHRYTD